MQYVHSENPSKMDTMILKQKKYFSLRQHEAVQTHLCNYDFLFQNLHCIIGSTGLLPHENHLPKRAFPQQL